MLGFTFGLTNRLQEAKEASNPNLHVEPEEKKAGSNAEIQISTKIQNLRGTDVFSNLRVPDEFQTTRSEIDVVVLTNHGIYCIEIKNWSGSITLSADQKTWYQHKQNVPSNGAKIISKPDPVAKSHRSARLLRNHLMLKGLCLKESWFFPKVLLVNKNCSVDKTILTNPAVLFGNECDRFVDALNESFLYSCSNAVVPSWITGQLSVKQKQLCRDILSSVGTWDIVDLVGGRRLVGDFKNCSNFTVDRGKTDKLAFSHQRSNLMTSMWAVVGYSPEAVVYFYSREKSILWETWTGSVKIPFNSTIAFRVAGDDVDSKIPANDIERILLSVS